MKLYMKSKSSLLDTDTSLEKLCLLFIVECDNNIGKIFV